MDSKPKTGTGIPQAEMPEIRLDDGKLRRTNQSLIGAVVVLAVALVGVSTWAIVDRSSGGQAAPAATQPTQIEVADAATVGFVEAVQAATTGEEFASSFTEDGVLDIRTDEVDRIVGRPDIASQWQDAIDMGWYTDRMGYVAQWDNFAAYAIAGPNEPSPVGKRDFHGMVLLELTPERHISHMWIFGNYRL